MPTKTLEKVVVKWVMIEDNLIRLTKGDDAFACSDDVKGFLSKGKTGSDLESIQNSLVDVDAEVEFTDGVITRVQLGKVSNEEVQKEAPKEETEEPKTDVPSDANIREVTISGVSVAKRGIIFKEDSEAKKWHTLADDLDVNHIKSLQGSVVKATIVSQDQGNDLVIIIEEVKDQSNNESKNSYDNSTYSSTQKSIEAQVAVEYAQQLYARLFANASPEVIVSKVEDINKLIDDRARRNYKLFQELKKDE